MGTQQLLIIVLGVIIVGIAVIVGINMTAVSFNEQITDLAIQKAHDIGMQANIFRKKTKELGGGNGSYKGFKEQLSELLKKDELVKRTNIWESKNTITINFVLTTKGISKRSYRIRARYRPDGLDRLRAYEPDKKEWIWLYKKKKE